MPTLNFTTKQAQKVQEATDTYNARTGEGLSPKRWVYSLIRTGVENELSGPFAKAGQEAWQADLITFKDQLATDMVGNA